RRCTSTTCACTGRAENQVCFAAQQKGTLRPSMSHASRIAQELSLRPEQVERTLALFAEGATLPFIARYRKEATGNLDEVQIGAIEEMLGYFRDLMSRKAAILASIQEQG